MIRNIVIVVSFCMVHLLVCYIDVDFVLVYCGDSVLCRGVVETMCGGVVGCLLTLIRWMVTSDFAVNFILF